MNKFLSEVLIGLLLGDLSAERAKPTHNTRLRFEQSLNKNEQYLYHLYDIFKEFVAQPPRSPSRKNHKKNKSHLFLYFI